MDASELRLALRAAAHVLDRGELTETASVREHLASALVHADKFMVGATTGQDDLAEAAVHLLQALELRERGQQAAQQLVADAESRRAR